MSILMQQGAVTPNRSFGKGKKHEQVVLPPLAHLLKRGHRVILVVAPFAVALVLGAFSFAPAAHAAYTVSASQLAPPPVGDCKSDPAPHEIKGSLNSPAGFAVTTDGWVCDADANVSSTIAVGVRDTTWDNWCAQVEVDFLGAITPEKSHTACGPGHDVNYDFSNNNPITQVRLLAVCGKKSGCYNPTTGKTVNYLVPAGDGKVVYSTYSGERKC